MEVSCAAVDELGLVEPNVVPDLASSYTTTSKIFGGGDEPTIVPDASQDAVSVKNDPSGIHKRRKPSSGFNDFQYEVPGLHNKMKKKMTWKLKKDYPSFLPLPYFQTDMW